MGCPMLSFNPPSSLRCLPPYFSFTTIPPSVFRSILKGTAANLIIDLPDAAVLRRGWNNLPSLQMGWPSASSALAGK